MNRRDQRKPAQPEDDDAAQCRLDKWLWAARFYKTRSLATQAVDAGHVRLNGLRPKPAREVRVGDRLSIQRDGHPLEVTVAALSSQRSGAAVASTLYQETAESVAARESYRTAAKDLQSSPRPAGRPSKRDRRQLQQFLEQS